MPLLTGNPVGRTLLFAQFSSHPWRLSPALTLNETRTFAASPSFDPLLHSLVSGPDQQGMAPGATRGPIVIGWGRWDRVCIPQQAKWVTQLFPDTRLYWFKHSGHFPMWDAPEETIRLILTSTG